MGFNGGIDFNTTPPTKFQSSINAIETVASISDRHTGALLFYSDGSKIWDATHNIMQNGTDIGLNEKTQTSAQGCVIVPFINDETKYYVFTRPSIKPFDGHLYYSVVDMTLNNGLGGVMASTKKIKIDTGFNEAMVAMRGCGIVWLVTQKKQTGDFYAYEISANGLNTTPVISPLNYSKRPAYESAMKASPDYKKIASTGRIFNQVGGDTYIAVHDFDGMTGRITNGKLGDTLKNVAYYGFEFSPNGKLLYVATERDVYQYNISLPTLADITASKTYISLSTSFFLNGMQLRDDGNIYIVRYESEYLDRISNCDALAPSCVYTDKAVEIGGKATYGLPARIAMPDNAKVVGSTTTDTSICNGIPIKISVDGVNVTWQDGSNDNSFNITQSGIYWVRSLNSDCEIRTDTFVVEDLRVDVTINDDTILCAGDTITLYANAQPSGTSYLWSNGSTNDTIKVSEGGAYRLIVNNSGCSDTDETVMTYIPEISIELGNDTQICKGVTLTLPESVTAAETSNYLWQDGSTETDFTVTEPGKYAVRVANQCQSITDSITVARRNCHLFFPSAFSPNGDGKNDIARMAGDVGSLTDFALNIYNRWGQLIYTGTNPREGWNGMHGASLADLGVYFYYIQYRYQGKYELMKGDITLVR